MPPDSVGADDQLLCESLSSSSLAIHWRLDSAIAYLNHGAFGACPTAVRDRQHQIQTQLERNPTRFFGQDYQPLLDAARLSVAAFVGSDAANLAFVPNATTGVNTVLRSLALPIDGQPYLTAGDELVTTDHAYSACRHTLDFVAACTGARVVVCSVPFPIHSPDEVLANIRQAVSARTKLALIDHITSPTGLVLPIADIVALLANHAIPTLIDGAHAPGMLDLDIDAVQPAFYTGNCHKWLCAPRGAAFIAVHPDYRALVCPLAIHEPVACSPRDRAQYRLSFDWTGTLDPSAYFCVPEAISHVGGLLPGGWPQIYRRNRALAIAARQIICNALELPLPTPDSMVGTLAAIPLPAEFPADVQSRLHDRYRIQVPIFQWNHRPVLRLSAHLYNYLDQYAALGRALVELRQ